MSKRKTFWPYGILISICAIILSCIITIIYSANYPVYEDDFYFDKYQNVKSNFHDIEKKEKVFNENFKLNIIDNNKTKFILNVKNPKKAYVLTQNDENIKLLLEKIKENNFDIKDISIKLTRPHTNKQDQNLMANIVKIDNNTSEFVVKLPSLSKGRWQIKVKIENAYLATFKTFDLVVE